ncbi:unnamed protein product [Haemonchus placei]|uniref:Transmembrane protein 144 n=1 Tax=Haemonchus placei TaxID=6290 RepID=A0A0N4X593_HAEPC|nr:unnamed protein product [Haemonchus placei]
MSEQNTAFGLISATLATALYGSCYVPVRWFEAGDGMYFQWLMCIGQLLAGVGFLALTDWPPIYPLAMLGGMFFAVGNALTITIMDGIGMAVGSLLWNTVTCVIGWAVSRFGLFGSLKKVPYDNVMNIIGVIVVCVGIAMKRVTNRLLVLLTSPPNCLLRLCCCIVKSRCSPLAPKKSETGGGSLTYTTFFFSFCLGALVTSTIIFSCYSVYRRNRPFINPELTAPSLLSGLMYGTATCFFFSANQHLDPIVAYPILAKAPGIVCALWAILLFKEIKGRWDVLHLFAGICVTLIGITLITVSKVKLF